MWQSMVSALEKSKHSNNLEHEMFCVVGSFPSVVGRRANHVPTWWPPLGISIRTHFRLESAYILSGVMVIILSQSLLNSSAGAQASWTAIKTSGPCCDHRAETLAQKSRQRWLKLRPYIATACALSCYLESHVAQKNKPLYPKVAQAQKYKPRLSR